MTADLRLGAFNAVGNPGTTISVTLTFVDSEGSPADVSSGVSLWTGGTVTLEDVTDLTDATEAAGTISGAGNNVATVSLPIPSTRQPLRMTINSAVVSVGMVSPTTIGGSPSIVQTITLAASTATVNIVGSVSTSGGGERTCGIHGDDTTSGRCPSCDAEPEARNSAAAPDQNLARASRRDEDYL